MTTTPDPTVVQPGYVTLEVDWLGDLNQFNEGELAHLTLKVVDSETMSNALDPETVKIEYQVEHESPVTLDWLYSDWDGTTIPFPPVSTGVLGRTNTGVFETWLDTTDLTGTWRCQATTTGAGQGASDVLQWYVEPQEVG